MSNIEQGLTKAFDSHGSHEFAAYTAKKLPNYIKCQKDFHMDNIEQGLTETFDCYGGHKVAAYTIKKLPNYIKCQKDWRAFDCK